MSLLTSVVVYGAKSSSVDSGALVFADEVANVNADGSSKDVFYPGDSRYLLVIVQEGYRLVSVKANDGTVVALGPVTRDIEERIFFTDKDKQFSLSQLPDGSVNPAWYGKGAVLTVEGQQVSANLAPCIADVSYSYSALQYRLTSPGDLNIGPADDDDWPIGVVVYVEAKS